MVKGSGDSRVLLGVENFNIKRLKMDLMLTLTFYLGGMSASCLTMHLHLRL